jgi:hypothetical protein
LRIILKAEYLRPADKHLTESILNDIFSDRNGMHMPQGKEAQILISIQIHSGKLNVRHYDANIKIFYTIFA